MNYTEILARQEELAKEMDELQQARVQCAKNKESLTVETTLTSGIQLHVDLDYATTSKEVFMFKLDGDTMYFGVEDYNEMSQFFSKYNDAIFSYMSEITKDETEEA